MEHQIMDPSVTIVDHVFENWEMYEMQMYEMMMAEMHGDDHDGKE